jgi:hypothetical protein
MKHFLAVLVVGSLALSGCQRPVSPSSARALTRSEAERVVDRLIGMGWLKYVPESKRKQVRSQLVVAASHGGLDSDRDPNGVSADRRSYPADTMGLAAGGIGKCVLLMKPILEREGVKLDEVEDNWHEEKYQVLINREPVLVYDGKEADSERASLERLLEIVNNLLEDAKSDERLFAFYRGKDGRVILLSEEMQDYVESLGDVLNEDWMPYTVEDVESAQDP